MKRYSLWIKLVLLVCAAVTIVSASHTSLAYIVASSNTMHNSFRVVYLPPQDISVPVTIQKTVINLSEESIGPGGFGFHLVDAETGAFFEAETSDDGLATVNLVFTAADVGKTYNYHLYELNDGREYVIFDETVYDISITLLLNEEHEMTAELMLDGNPVTEIVVEYVNEYYVPVPLPDTGDYSHPMLWAAMMVLSGLGLILQRRNRAAFRRK